MQIYQPVILSIAQRRGLQYADAMEVAQDVLSRIASKIATWQPDPNRGSFRGWLYQITRNLTVDHLRRQGRHAPNAGDFDWASLPDPSRDESAEFRSEFERRLFGWAAAKVKSGFADDNWQAFWLTTVESERIEDVAERLGISRGKVYVARSRVMARIAQVIRERLDETDECSMAASSASNSSLPPGSEK